jgi:hypothetical protein
MKNKIDIDSEVQKIYDRMFEKRYSGNELANWNCQSFFGGANSEKYKSLIRELVEKSKRVKSGYRCSSIRNYHEHFIFWKD